MAKLVFRFDPELSWKSWSAIAIFGCGFVGLVAGVGVSERPGVPEADLFTKAYYAFGLFVLGGLDLGTPTGGPLYGRILLWVAYFAAPIWTASAVIETILHALRPPVWSVRSVKNKIVIIGGGELTLGFLNRITASGNARRVIVIIDESQHPHLDELRSYRGVRVFVVSGDQMHRMRRYPLHKASKFLLLSEKDEINFEIAASIFLLHSNSGRSALLLPWTSNSDRSHSRKANSRSVINLLPEPTLPRLMRLPFKSANSEIIESGRTARMKTSWCNGATVRICSYLLTKGCTPCEAKYCRFA